MLCIVVFVRFLSFDRVTCFALRVQSSSFLDTHEIFRFWFFKMTDSTDLYISIIEGYQQG